MPISPGNEDGIHVGSELEVCTADGNLRKLCEIEADIINFAVSHYGGRMSEVARRLRISRSTLYRKIDPAK